MDENTSVPAGNEQPKKQRSSVLRHIMAVLLTLVLMFLAMLVFLFRDELTGEGIRRNFGREPSLAEEYEAFTYETGAEQVFASVGEGLAVATSSSVQLLDAAGETVFKQVVSYELPAVFGGAESALFCDLGGTGCTLARLDGESVSITPPGEIITASLTESGWPVLVTNEAGYKSRVSVYNSACELQFEWWSGSGYVLRAVLGPDNRTLAVVTVEKDCGMLRFFTLDSDAVAAELSFPETLYYDLHFMGSDTVCLVGEEGLLFVSSAGELRGDYSVDGNYMVDYSFGGQNFAAVFVSSYRSGAGGTLVTLDQRGQVLGERTLERDIISLSAGSKQLLVMTGGGLYLFGQDLLQQAAKETLITAKKAVLRPGGDVLLLSAYSAERMKF